MAAREISSHIENVAESAKENSYMAKQTADVANYLVSLAQSKIES
jgi:methyl-accepting chemotaxis protein